jgi:hypothetical protein
MKRREFLKKSAAGVAVAAIPVSQTVYGGKRGGSMADSIDNSQVDAYEVTYSSKPPFVRVPPVEASFIDAGWGPRAEYFRGKRWSSPEIQKLDQRVNKLWEELQINRIKP